MKIDINQAKFLDSAVDIKHKDILTIESEGKWYESARFKKEDGTPVNEFKLNIKLTNGEIRNVTLSWTNVKMLVEALGDDSVDWIGKQVRAWKTKSEKAKIGYVYLLAPMGWTRDDTGEWSKGTADKISENQDTVKHEEVPSVQLDEPEEESINVEDIPF